MCPTFIFQKEKKSVRAHLCHIFRFIHQQLLPTVFLFVLMTSRYVFCLLVLVCPLLIHKHDSPSLCEKEDCNTKDASPINLSRSRVDDRLKKKKKEKNDYTFSIRGKGAHGILPPRPIKKETKRRFIGSRSIECQQFHLLQPSSKMLSQVFFHFLFQVFD